MKRGAVIGIGTVFLVIGFGGLALLQTRVINPPSSISPVNLSEVKPSRSGSALPSVQTPMPPVAESSPSVPQAPAAKDLRRQKPVPVPQVGKGERRYPGEDQPGPAPSASKKRGTKEKSGLAARRAERELAATRTESKHFARNASAKAHAGKAESKSSARKTGSKAYARNTKSERYAHKSSTLRVEKDRASSGTGPVVIRFRFDPTRNRELNVARVHSGDEVKVKVRRVGPGWAPGLLHLLGRHRFETGRPCQGDDGDIPPHVWSGRLLLK